ncbi:MAG: SufD family Fe-S cluster assembly protein [Nitrososphaeraceae archaeon]
MPSLSSLSLEDIHALSSIYNEPEWMTRMREQNFANYQSLPAEISPLYSKYSDVNRLYPDRIELTVASNSSSSNDFLADRMNELDKEVGLIRVGSTIIKLNRGEVGATGDAIIIEDLAKAVNYHEGKIKDVLLKHIESHEEDKFLALESSAFKSGIFIYVPKNLVVENPIRLICALSQDNSSSISRNLVIADEGSKCTIVQELYSPSINGSRGVQQGVFELTECHVGNGSNLEMITLEALDSNNISFLNKKAWVERDAKMSWYHGLFGGQTSRCKVDSNMRGIGSSAEDVEIIFGNTTQSFDITSNLNHIGSHSRGRVLVKSVMRDKSKSLFKGMIKIGKDAKASESYLAGHAILLDKDAKSDAIPGLEIETNEVKATHSASVAQLDEAQIYYLMCRGLNRDSAKREIVSGFLEPLSRRMGPTIRAWINYLLENKWSGKPLILKADDALGQMLEVEKSRYRESQDLFEKHYKYR